MPDDSDLTQVVTFNLRSCRSHTTAATGFGPALMKGKEDACSYLLLTSVLVANK